MTRCPWLATCSSSSFAALSHPSWRHRSLRCFGGELARAVFGSWLATAVPTTVTDLSLDGCHEARWEVRRSGDDQTEVPTGTCLWKGIWNCDLPWRSRELKNWSCHWIWNKILLLVLFYICKSCWLSYHLSGVVKCLCQCFLFHIKTFSGLLQSHPPWASTSTPGNGV